jgi:hypothetical protein
VGTRGTLSMWVDILDLNTAKAYPPLDISLPAPAPYVLRVVIWRVRGARSMDEITDQNDMFVTGRVEGTNPADGALVRQQKQTDTHWRCKGGKASFNYRWTFDVQVPMKHSRLVLQAWDRDLLSNNDLIGETSLSIQGLFSRAHRARLAQEGRDPMAGLPAPAAGVGGAASGGGGGGGLLRYPSEEVARMVADDGEGAGEEPGGPGAGKPGRVVALKALRKGEAPEAVALRLAEAGHGQWTPEELVALQQHDSAASRGSGGKA